MVWDLETVPVIVFRIFRAQASKVLTRTDSSQLLFITSSRRQHARAHGHARDVQTRLLYRTRVSALAWREHGNSLTTSHLYLGPLLL